MDNPERVTYFAATDARGKRIPFGIKQKDRARHMYVIGKTGMGKSTLLENMAIQDIQNGEGLAFIDPHGGTAEKLLDYIPESRMKDVVYFAPFDLEQPIAFNVMEDVGYDKRHLVVSGLMATFKKIWVDAWSARMEYILSNTLLALLEYPGATLLGVNRMYTDKAYRKQVVDNVKDPLVKDFWVKEFATYTDRYTQEATPAIQNKIGQFTSNPLIRNIIGQPHSSFDIRTMMDQKKIIIINLSKGLVGEVNMRLLGSMITTRIFLASMSRADASAIDLNKLPNFYFYVDEFQNFANETFAEVLSEARKYKLNLIIAHQYIEQMDEIVRPAVFGNVGTTVVFRVGPFDAEVLETVFMPEFTKEDLVNLGLRQVYLTLMIDGIGSRPFSAVTIPPIQAPATTFKEEVIESSRQQFGSPRAGIESAIIEGLGVTTTASEPAESKPRPKPAYKRDAPREYDAPRPRPERDERPRETEPSSRREVKPEAASNPAPRQEVSTERPTPPPRDYGPRPDRMRTNPPRREPPPEARVQSAPRPLPAAAGKSAEDLKAILKNVSLSANSDKQAKVSDKQTTLKNTLADVMKRSGVPAAPPSAAFPPSVKENMLPAPQAAKPIAPVPAPKPAFVIPAPAPLNPAPLVTSVPPASITEATPAPVNPPGPEQKPFEIPEDQLRKVLNGET